MKGGVEMKKKKEETPKLQCDYCEEEPTHVVYVCEAHLKVLDQVANRREDHVVEGVEVEAKKK